ncbi:MAG TPA: Fe-S metabolism protein SufE [Cytophagales bacterium]|nr:Fe-S metabolism protein SufE [Cytophagales bacterium]
MEAEIIEEFDMFDDWMDKYSLIIDRGKKLPMIDAAYKTDEYLIKGCQSKVWLHAAPSADGRILFMADSDAIITKGIISLLIEVLSNQKPEDIATAKLDFIEKTGLREHLTSTRGNGLVSMIEQMKAYAAKYAQLKS